MLFALTLIAQRGAARVLRFNPLTALIFLLRTDLMRMGDAVEADHHLVQPPFEFPVGSVAPARLKSRAPGIVDLQRHQAAWLVVVDRSA